MPRSLGGRLALAYAVLIVAALALLGALLVAVAPDSPDARAPIIAVLLPGGALIAMLALAAALLIARAANASLAHLQRVAARLAAGDLTARALADLPAEMAQLADAINQMAERLQATIGSLRAERARLDAVLAHMADGLLLVDSDDTVTQINPAAQRILDASASHAEGRSFTQVARDHELTACLRAARESGQETARIVEQSGSHRFLRMVATPQPGPNGAPAMLVLLQDLTELRRLETIRRDFVSNISHELRTPLASLQALAETLADGALDDPPAARRFVNRIEEEVRQLHALLTDLLDLSAMESGRAELRLEPTELVALVRRAAGRLQPQAERAGVRLRVLESPPLVARADAARIEQVLINLIHNAVKFTPPGGEIECRASRQADHASLSVRDNGVGISAEALPRVFERFYTGDKARAGASTGLGLAIARHIVELHGGAIAVDSVEGRGATFVFTLPLA